MGKFERALMLLLIGLTICSTVTLVLNERALAELERDLAVAQYEQGVVRRGIEALEGKSSAIEAVVIDGETAELMARIVEQEAAGEGLKGKIAVANVIINRTKDPRFPDTIQGVITARGQFESYESGRYARVDVSREAHQAVELALAGEAVVDEDVVFFCNFDIISKTNKKWFSSLQEAAKIKNHTFYK